MKRLLSIIIISIFLISLCVLDEVVAKKTLDEINQKGEQLFLIAVNNENINTEEILIKTRELFEIWNTKQEFLCFFVNYKDMHEMGNELIKMISYCKNNIKEEYTTSLELVIYYCETFKHIMGVSLNNIF
ncbi:MAG: DUF4363 family protein [Clostridiales bacterium]|nr:DUF4363 family protein [Clostridiales bacterium]